MGVCYRKEERYMAKDLIEDLKGGLCLVKFQSLKRGGEREMEKRRVEPRGDFLV